MVKVERGKRRYLLLHFFAEGRPLEASEAKGALLEKFRELFGLEGLAEAELAWIGRLPDKSLEIVRCNHKAVSKVRTAIALIGEIRGRRVRICTVRVSGSLRRLKKASEGFVAL